MAKKKPTRKKAGRKAARRLPSGAISLVALHHEFDRIQKKLNVALKKSPKSAGFQQLQQDLNGARQLMDCSQTAMGING